MSTLFATGKSAENKIFYTGEYPDTHWAMEKITWETHPNLIAFASYGKSEYAIYLNPIDSRGYRSIVTLTDSENPASTFNRDYTTKERVGLYQLISLVSDVYSRFTPMAQSSVAGNNSHSFDEKKRVTYVGNDKEPSMLHGHIYGRGNPEMEYIQGVKLGGPRPGEIFDMRGKTPKVPGNDDGHVKWKEGDMKKVAFRVREEVEKVKTVYEKLGLNIVTQ